MKQYKGYLIDLDGTLYYGTRRIPSAEQFIRELKKRDQAFLFLTNNATRTTQEIVENLRENYELPIGSENVYTSTQALIAYMKENCLGKVVHVVGELALHQQVEEAGFQLTLDTKADVVVQGLNRQATYEELALAATAIRDGAEFLVTNADQTIPTEKGIMPSSGALTAFLEVASGKKGLVMGKPNALIVKAALEELNLKTTDVLLIGDKYETDILAGINAGVDTLLVLTGVTRRDDVPSLPIQPTYVLENLSEWVF
ncbi:TIGR01457 family HAD-type hydrolase [Fundicoccus sp. Sow4_D5]|uniref:TIGR01457 family HAD-type hydrolase n=1 Tax=unclassified Fundicoccus TaxID=2761543 RepID=UPI003F9047C8